MGLQACRKINRYIPDRIREPERFDKFSGQKIWAPTLAEAPEGRGPTDGTESILSGGLAISKTWVILMWLLSDHFLVIFLF